MDSGIEQSQHHKTEQSMPAFDLTWLDHSSEVCTKFGNVASDALQDSEPESEETEKGVVAAEMTRLVVLFVVVDGEESEKLTSEGGSLDGPVNGHSAFWTKISEKKNALRLQNK